MKAASKYDQMRLMREANYQPREEGRRGVESAGSTQGIESEVVPDIRTEPTINAMPPIAMAQADQSGAPCDTVSNDTVAHDLRADSDTVAEGGTDTVSWLAPEGQCPHCDKRRTALQATMRKRRAKQPSAKP